MRKSLGSNGRARGSICWRQRHGPVLPLVSGVLTLLAAAGVLVMLILGIFWGLPDNPNAFNWWAPISVVVLVLVAREWSRPYFAGFALVVVALVLVLVVELGQNVNHQNQISNARSTEQGLALVLGKSEHVAAATQLKALAFSVTGPANSPPSPPRYATPGDLAPRHHRAAVGSAASAQTSIGFAAPDQSAE